MDERIWEGLLSTALAILDDLDARGLGAPDVAMGGGTVLMMRMHHRLSKDIDLCDAKRNLDDSAATPGDFTKMVPTMIDSALAWIGSVEDKRGRPS